MDRGRALAFGLADTVRDERVLEAIATVPRERFVPRPLRRRAYDNVALPIGRGQTISQPLVVARMLELLELTGTERVLDVGTGSGYHAALLGRLAGEVWTIEIDRALSAGARRRLAAIAADNVTCRIADGWSGLPDEAPFDAINVAAAPGGELPQPLGRQLAVGGRLVYPGTAPGATEDDGDQRLRRLRSGADGLTEEVFERVRFVPLIRS